MIRAAPTQPGEVTTTKFKFFKYALNVTTLKPSVHITKIYYFCY